MNTESNESHEQRIARLEDNVKNLVGILQSVSSLFGKTFEANITNAHSVLQLWNGQISLLKFITSTMPNMEEGVKRAFLTQIARMESQTEKIEAMIAELKGDVKSGSPEDLSGPAN
jgi:hypothetical protein